MVALRVELACDGCGGVFGESNFPTIGSARKAAAVEGWAMLHVMNRDFDFCQVCQREATEQDVKTKAKGA